MRSFQLPGRSPVHAMNGMAATSHPLATLAAVNVLQDGGNAMDAAVTACAVQCVVEPMSTGIGGDCFAVFSPKGGAALAFNGSGRAPRAATAEWFGERGIHEIDPWSPHAVTVPGAIDAWSRLLADHGTRSLGDALEPAIRFARDGYPVYSRAASAWQANRDTVDHDPPTRATFLADGRTPEVGSVHRQPRLAETLEHIAETGRDGFYTGSVAEDVVSHLRDLGGLHTMADFAEAEGEYVEPIKTAYKGYEVYECPPNGQGIIALEILNVLSELGADGGDPLSVERLHLEIEAARLAYRDRDAVVADPRMAQVPVDHLLSRENARALAGEIRADRAMQTVPPSPFRAHSDTVYLAVVDRERTAVSFINSLFMPFGGGLSGPETGVLLQNRGAGFVLDPDHPNCIAPGKRPLHTIIPGMLVKDGRAVMPFGVMGGHFQAMGHVHFLTNVIDYGLDVQEALDLPRVFPFGGVVDVEEGVPDAVARGLDALGHRTQVVDSPHGAGQAIWIDWEEGVLTGGSDPRKDGCAIGY